MNDRYAPIMAKAGTRKRQSPLCKLKFNSSPITVTARKKVRPFVIQFGPRNADQPASPLRIAHAKPKVIVRLLMLALSLNQNSNETNSD